MDGESDSSDGVEVLDLTSPHPPPRTRRARTTPALSSPGSSIVSEPVATKKPSEGKQLKAGVNKRGRQEGNDTGLESDSSNDFDLDRWGTQSRVSLKSPAARVSSASLAVDAAETKPHEDRDIQFERACGGPVSMTSIPVSVSGRKITGAGEGKGADKLSVSPYVAATACTTPAEKTAVGVFGADTERTSVVELLSDSEDDEPACGSVHDRGKVRDGGGRSRSEGGPIPAATEVEVQEVDLSGEHELLPGADRGEGPASCLDALPEQRSRREGEEDEGGGSGAEDALGLDEFDTLILASQTSRLSSPPRGGSSGRPSCGDDRIGDDERRVQALDLSDSDGNVEGEEDRGDENPGGVELAAGGGMNGDAGGMSKEERARSRKEERANRKRQREEAAAAAKQQREQERLARRQEKERAKQAEKELRAARKQIEQQARGNFSHLEVACVMERRYYEDPANACARAGASKQPNCTEEFMVVAADCPTHGAIWWTRRDHLSGGAAADGPGVETLDMLLVVVHSHVLLASLERAGGGPDPGGEGRDGVEEAYPDLGRYVDSVRCSNPGFSRLILVLEGGLEELHRRWSARQRGGDGRSTPFPTLDVLEDALAWLLIHKDAETRLTKDAEETGQYLWDFTRALSTMPYKDDISELHCVNRLKSKAPGSESLPQEDEELADTWVRMLQQVPGISESKAIAIASHYPLPRALAAALSDPSMPEETRAVLLADKMGSNRHEGRRARRLFDLFTQEDGDFILS